MASRFEQNKPDPAIKANVLRSRAKMQKGKNGTALVVTTSLAATIGAWVLLANPAASVSTDTQATGTSQYVTSQITGTVDTFGSNLTLTPTPTAQSATGPTEQNVSYIAQPTAVAVTRSSQ